MNYYNEHDPNAAAWLRELIRRKLIPNGIVDEQDIQKIRLSDLSGFVQVHCFAGIGGWPLALRLAGWPEDRPVWTGSCPCQPFSVAGAGGGTSDPRHLWPVFFELIKQCRPPVCFGEQVASAAGRAWLAGVFADLERVAYRRAAADLCAAGIGAPHIRQRLFWVADTEEERGLRGISVEDWKCQKPGRPSTYICTESWPGNRGSLSTLSVADVLSPSYGVPGRVGLLRGYGNAIVPPLAAEFIGAYLDCQ